MGKYADLYAKFGRDINSDAEKNKETTQEKPAAKTSRGKYSDLYAKFGRDLGGRRTKAAQEEAQQKVEEKNDALRNAQSNYRRQYLINEATKRENEKEAEAEQRRSRRFANVAAARAYTDTASSERSYEDRVKAAEVERIQAENRIRARSSDGQEAQRDDEARYNYIARRIDTQEKAKKVEEAPGAGKLTAEQLKEESAIGGVTKGDLAWYKEEKARRDEAAAQKKAAEEYFESLKTYYNNLTLDLDAAKAEYDRVAGIKRLLDNAGSELEKMKTENPQLWNEIDGIAQFLYGGPKAKQYGEGKMVDDGPDADYFGDNDDIARQHAYTRYILRQYGYKDYDALAKEVAEKGNTWATARDIQESYKLVTDAKADPEFEAWAAKGAADKDNSVMWARGLTDEEAESTKSTMGVGTSGLREDVIKRRMLTQDELDIYNYYYGKGDKDAAYKYYNSLDDLLAQRSAVYNAKVFGDSFFGKANMAIYTGFEQFANGVYRKIGPKQEYYYPTVSQYTSAILTQDMGGVEKFWYDLGVNVSNMAPSIIAGKLASYINPVFGELVGAATMGLSASGNAYAEAINSGMTPNQASAYSNLIGLSETTLQAAIGGIPYVGGAVTGGVFTKAGTKVLRFAGGLNSGMAKVATKALGYGLKYVGKSFGEFVEEGLQEVLEPYFAAFVTGEAPDDVDWDAVFYSAGMGFITSLLLNAGDSAVNVKNARSKAKDVINQGGAELAVRLGLQFDEKSDVYRIAKEIQRDGYDTGNIAELLMALETETQNDPDFAQRFTDRDFGELNIKPKNETKTIDKNAKKIGKYVEKQDATEGAAYEAATQTPISESVAGQDVRGEEVSPVRTAEEFVSRYNGEVAENATTEARPDTNAVDEGAARTSGTNVNTAAETNAPTVANVPAETVPSDNENVITVKRAKVSDASKAVSRITKNGKAIEGGGRYYVYDTAGTTAIRYDDAPANVSFTSEDGLAGRIDRVLNTEGDDTGVVFDTGKISDLKTAINTVKQIKSAYGDKGATVVYNFGDGVVVDAAKVLDVAEALPGATVQRVPVGNGYYGLKFVVENGVGLVMPINAKDVSAAEDSVFLIRGRNTPASASVVLGNNSWSPAEGEAAIPAKSSDRVFNDDLTFNLADDTVNDTINDTINENGAETDADVIDLTEDSELTEELRGKSAKEIRRSLFEYIKRIFGNKEITLSDGRKAIVDKGDARKLSDRSSPEWVAKIAKVQELINKAQLTDEDPNPEHKKFTHFWYYKASVKTERGVISVYLNIGKARTDTNNHLYDITESIRDTARPYAGGSVNPTYSLKNGISTSDIVTENGGKVNTESEKTSKSQQEDASDRGKVQKSAEKSSEKVQNIPERGENGSETTGRGAAANENTEGSVKKRGGRNVFRSESGKYSEIDGINDDGDVVLEGGETLDVDSLDPEARSAVDTVLADFYSGRISEAQAMDMLRNGTLTYTKGENAWIAEELNDGNTAKLMSPQQIEAMAERLFGIYINYGRVQGRRTMGFMRQGERGLRTRTVGMLPTVSHELTHILDLTDGRELSKLTGIQEVIKAAPQAWLAGYPKSARASEAVAWFGEQYFRSRKTAQQISPEFFRNFEASFSPTELKKLHELGDAVNKFMVRETDAEGNDITMLKQSRAQLATQAVKPKDMRALGDKARELALRFETKYFNSNAPFEKSFGDKAAVLYNADIISGAARATYMINGTDALIGKKHSGGFDTSDGRHIEDLSTILSPLEKSGKEAYDDFNTYLVLRRGGYKVIEGKRVFASDMANNPSEISRNIDLLEKAHPEFREIADKAIEFHRELVKKTCVDTGLMSEETFDQMTKEDPFYVPFRRDVDGTHGSGVNTTLQSAKQFKRMRGSGRDIYNPVESLFQDAYETVVSSLRAQYGDYILDSVDADPAGMEWLATKVNAKVNLDVTDLSAQRDSFRGQLVASGLDQKAVDAIMSIYDGTVGDEVKSFRVPYYQGEDFFLRRRWHKDANGKESSTLTCYQFNSAFGKAALQNTIDNSVNFNSKAVNALMKLSHIRKIFLTGSSPLFTVRNLIRDAQDAYAYSRIKNPLEFTKRYIGALKSVLTADQAYMDYKKAGGGNSTRISSDVRTIADVVPAVYKAHTKKSVQLMQGMVRFAPSMIERINEAVEQVPRMLEFKHSLDHGGSMNEALYRAANITVNFGQHGAAKSFISLMGGIFPFFNAGMQGRYRMYQALKTDTVSFLAKKTLTALVRNGILFGLVKAFGAEDEYKKLSNYIKNNYYVIPIGKGSFIRLPKDREGGILDSLMENAVSSLMYGTDGEQWYDYATYLIDQVGGPGTIESFLGYLVETLHDGGQITDVAAGIMSDTVASPIFDLMRNKDYRGVKIETTSDQKLPQSERYDENTSALAKFLGSLGVLSPKQVQHLVESLGFIPAAVISLPENFAEGGLFGPAKSFANSFATAFTSSSAYSNDAINDFYDGFEKLEMKKNADGGGEIRAEYARASGVKTIMSELYKMRRETESEEEREAITRIIRDSAYDYLHADTMDDHVEKELIALYDRIGDKDYAGIFYSAPKASWSTGGVTYSLDLATYLEYAEEYRGAVRSAYSIVFANEYSNDTELAEDLEDAKELTAKELKRKYMLRAKRSSDAVTTERIRSELEYGDSGADVSITLKEYVTQERGAGRKDEGIRQSLSNIFRADYKEYAADGDKKMTDYIEQLLIGLGIGFTSEKIRKWAD